jgi:hypothetical protein
MCVVQQLKTKYDYTHKKYLIMNPFSLKGEKLNKYVVNECKVIVKKKGRF